MNLGIQVSQKQTQILTTEQLQHLEILQFSNMELESYIYQRANDNPLMTVIEPNVKHVKSLVDFSITNFKNKAGKVKQSNVDYVNNVFVAKDSNIRFLLEQIPLHQNLSKKDVQILKYLIHNLDENYFLAIEVDEVAALFQTDVEEVINILFLLQTFEPIGIGARSLNEYLLIQIDSDPNAPSLAEVFVQNHLEDIANLSIKNLSKRYKISIKETQDIIHYIRSLNPSPYVPHTSTFEGYIVPEVVVQKIEGEWVIQLNHQHRPKIEINQEYVEMLKSSEHDKTYCRECLKDIMLLLNGIDQRDRTLYSLTRLLLDIQAEFFEHGMKALKPVRLRDMADALEVHESTISRSIRNKYLKTPHGIYAFRSLFVKGIVSHSGKMDSVLYIKQKIRTLIEQEEKSAPLTDQQLMTELQNEGIQISRRTVAKYREELNIVNSSKRVYMYQ